MASTEPDNDDRDELSRSLYAARRVAGLGQVETTRAGHLDSRVILQRGAHHFQERIRQLDEQSRLVRSFAPTAVLGILQTHAYA